MDSHLIPPFAALRPEGNPPEDVDPESDGLGRFASSHRSGDDDFGEALDAYELTVVGARDADGEYSDLLDALIAEELFTA